MPRPSQVLRSLARLGAQQRILQLRVEAEEIYRQFPDLRTGSAASTNGDAPRRRRRRRMSAAQRKAVGARMRKYWAARRKEGEK
jgi:hypothetical protein